MLHKTASPTAIYIGTLAVTCGGNGGGGGAIPVIALGGCWGLPPVHRSRVVVGSAREPAQDNREFKRAGRQGLQPATSRLAAVTLSNDNPLDICRLYSYFLYLCHQFFERSFCGKNRRKSPVFVPLLYHKSLICCWSLPII